jgi:hypothetical protein
MQVSGFSFPLRYKAVIWFLFPLSVRTMVRTFKYHTANYRSMEIETIKESVKLSWVTNYCPSDPTVRASAAKREITSGMNSIERRDHLF